MVVCDPAVWEVANARWQLALDLLRDLLEAGVWRGGAAIFMKGVLSVHGETRTVYLADSFAGVPPPDRSYPQDRGNRLWASPELAVPLEDVRARFERYGLLDERVRFLPGRFAETLPSCEVERLALLRLDGDLYESTIVPLEALYHRVADGGYVIVDDYGVLPGARAAVDDFRRKAGILTPLEWVDYTCVLWRKG